MKNRKREDAMKNFPINRSFLHQILLMFIAISLVSFCLSTLASTQPIKPTLIQEKLAELETSMGGRLGISAVNTANNMYIQYHAGERFPMGCTSKVMGVSAILKKSITDHSLLQQKMTYTKKDLDLAEWVPVTQKHLATGMTIFELCGAAIMQSDNAAMNILMKKLGGPGAVNAFARSIGDNTFRVDRGYPEEASSIPGDLRDTSTPAAMEKSFQRLVLDNILALPQREQLQVWLKSNTTGNARIRAGVPKGWLVGDKTGTGDYGTTNDVAIIWPPKCQPIIVAIYLTQNKQDAVHREDILASVTRLLLNEFTQNDQCIKLKSS